MQQWRASSCAGKNPFEILIALPPFDPLTHLIMLPRPIISLSVTTLFACFTSSQLSSTQNPAAAPQKFQNLKIQRGGQSKNSLLVEPSAWITKMTLAVSKKPEMHIWFARFPVQFDDLFEGMIRSGNFAWRPATDGWAQSAGRSPPRGAGARPSTREAPQTFCC